jgi:hypothetical protein
MRSRPLTDTMSDIHSHELSIGGKPDHKNTIINTEPYEQRGQARMIFMVNVDVGRSRLKDAMKGANHKEVSQGVGVDGEPFVLRHNFRTCLRFHLASLRLALTVLGSLFGHRCESDRMGTSDHFGENNEPGQSPDSYPVDSAKSFRW